MLQCYSQEAVTGNYRSFTRLKLNMLMILVVDIRLDFSNNCVFFFFLNRPCSGLVASTKLAGSLFPIRHVCTPGIVGEK